MNRARDIIRVSSEITPRDLRRQVIRNAAARHGLSVAALIGPSRQSEIVAARWEAMRAIHEQFGDNAAAIGRLFNRDHSTVLHALRKVAA